MREEAIRTAKIRFDDALQRVARSLTSSTKTNGERIGVVGTDGNALGDGEDPFSISDYRPGGRRKGKTKRK